MLSLRTFLLDRFLLPASFEQSERTGVYRADFICPQAFGRNAYPDKEVGPVVRAARENLGSDIEAFEWLKSKHFDPGQPNMLIADLCHDLANGFGIPIIGQWEVMYDLYCNMPFWYKHKAEKGQLIAIWPPTEGRLTTRELLLAVKVTAGKRGRRTPILVAHPEHIQRCYFLGRNIFDGNPAAMTDPVSNRWFNQRSVQWRTRGKWHWRIYELCLARPYHRIKDWF